MHFYEKEAVSIYLENLELLEDFSSSKQNIKIARHPFLGLVLIINEEIQHIQNYQCLYHELLVHLPASFIEEPKTALIIGGGSLFAAHEILKYPSIEKITLCDYDHDVLNTMAKYYQHARSVIKDSRFNFIEKDGWEFINNCQEKYDLIINDCFNLLEISQKNNASIYKKLKGLLTANGICSDIVYRHVFDSTITHDSIAKIKELGSVVLSLVTVPEYPGILHIETLWGNNRNLSQDKMKVINQYQRQIINGEKNPFEFFSPENLAFYLYLPPYIKAKL